MLDPAGRRDLLAVLDDLHREGLTVIAITHTMAEATRAQRVIALHEGRVALDGPPQRVFSDPAVLAPLGLALPPPAALAHRLHSRFPALPTGLLTPDDLAAAVAEVVA